MIDERAKETLIEAEINRALELHRDDFAPEVLEYLRPLLRLGLHTHPAAIELIRRLSTKVPAESGSEPIAGSGAAGAKRESGA
jgi:hypothetical protein